ncbi:MAG: hypothetical protein RSF68_08565 [Myroides sp.]
MRIKLRPFFILLFCFFCSITKSHAQREIHPLEPTFTYDYALKYYGNLTLGDYWSLDNFKAPKGVKSIKQYESFYDWNDFYRSRDRMLNGEKKIYYYNKDTGFLERSIYLERNHKMKSTHFYSYKTDSLHLTISIKNNYFAREFSTNTIQYIYDLKTENLLEIRYNNDNKDFIKYTYDKNQKDLTGVEDNSNWRRQEITISYDTLKPIDKIKYYISTRIGKKYKFKNDSVYLNKEETLVNLLRRNLALKTFSTGYKTISNGKSNREYYENLYHTQANYIDFGANYISYNLGYPQYISDYPRPIDRMGTFKFPQTGTFLFDEKGKLSFIKYHTDIIRENLFTNNRSSRYPWMPETERENSISIIEKKNDNKWIFISYNELQIKKKLFSRYNRFKTKKRQKANYKIKNGSIYKDKKPIIIYNYYH